jgi:uncharacterized protein (DUF1015 family)
MSLVRPFPARIVRQERATEVVCPMHDALSAADRAELLASNPLSYLQVTRSVLDMPGATTEQLGAANAAGLERLLESGAYSELSAPALYVYRVHRGEEEHTGIVAELDAAGFVDGRVLGHESVQPERVQALVHHFEAVPTRSELVTVLHRADAEVASLVEATTRRQPVLSLTDRTGVDQVVWRVADADVPLVTARLGAVRHYIADGHHRVAATVQRWRDHGSPRGGGVLSVVYPDDQMHLLAFHRRVAGPVDPARLLTGLAAAFHVEPVERPVRGPGELGMRLAGSWYRVRPRHPRTAPGVAGLDVTLLDEQLLHPLLGVASGDPRVSYVSELTDLGAAAASADAEGAVLFLLAAPSLDQLVEVAERGEVMPQKSTYIEPKPRAGVFLRPRQGPVDPKDVTASGDPGGPAPTAG